MPARWSWIAAPRPPKPAPTIATSTSRGGLDSLLIRGVGGGLERARLARRGPLLVSRAPAHVRVHHHLVGLERPGDRLATRARQHPHELVDAADRARHEHVEARDLQ